MKYSVLALTTALAVLSALPAWAGRVWIDAPYSRRDRDRTEVIVSRCYNSARQYLYDLYGCRYIIRRDPYRRYYRVNRPFRDPDRIYYPNRYRHHRRGTVQIRIGY
jgi:hypothetical protein